MNSTIMIIFIAFVLSTGVAYFQYIRGSKSNIVQKIVFATLRFLSIFTLVLLLCNPKLKQESFFIEKPNLVIVADNSNSVQYLKQKETINRVVKELKMANLSDRFDLEYYAFDSDIRTLDSLDFQGNQSNLDKVFKSLKDLKKDTKAPTILITDGNQTFGADYQFSANQYNQLLYPVILGEDSNGADLSIKSLIVNKYAYLDNKFPVEITLEYNGKEPVSSVFRIKSGSSIVFSQNVEFSSEKPVVIINTLLNATRTGTLRYEATIKALLEEKNKENNERLFAIEVIDEATNVAIVADVVHPDIGLLKKSIESNIQRKAVIIEPTNIEGLNDYQLIVLYQPTSSFAPVYRAIEQLDKNYFTITGKATDWSFLNQAQGTFRKEMVNSFQKYGGGFNNTFTIFQLEDLGFSDYPPLEDRFGEVILNKEHQNIVNQTINGFETNNPLLSVFEYNGKKEAVLFGENIWRWRAQSYLTYDSFEAFDQFMGKIIQFLASNKKKERLTIDYEPFYYGANDLRITAQYFDKNYEFDAGAKLMVFVNEVSTDKRTEFPMLLKNNFYELDLTSLTPGNYEFLVKAEGKGVQQSGRFEIIPFNVEEQFLNANVTKLSRIATNSGGKSFVANDIQGLINELKSNTNFTPIQRSRISTKSLINWKSLLLLLIVLLAAEWFLRKYKGLI